MKDKKNNEEAYRIAGCNSKLQLGSSHCADHDSCNCGDHASARMISVGSFKGEALLYQGRSVKAADTGCFYWRLRK